MQIVLGINQKEIDSKLKVFFGRLFGRVKTVKKYRMNKRKKLVERIFHESPDGNVMTIDDLKHLDIKDVTCLKVSRVEIDR